MNRERPIIFSGPMVRAIREGRKTQTRRIVKPQPADSAIMPRNWSEVLRRREQPDIYGGDGLTWGNVPLADGSFGNIRCPYSVGDTLWVRETWRTLRRFDDKKPKDLRPSVFITYAADGYKPYSNAAPEGGRMGKSRSARFMPRWAARIFLRVTGVRVERGQEISEEDVIAEGIDAVLAMQGHDDIAVAQIQMRLHCSYPRARYVLLWDGLNGRRAPWSSNPWVWVYEFEEIET